MMKLTTGRLKCGLLISYCGLARLSILYATKNAILIEGWEPLQKG
jgi:hypothetical protein